MTLGRYIQELLRYLKQFDVRAYGRVCRLVGRRVARIQLDAEAVYVCMRGEALEVLPRSPDDASPPEGEGVTDTSTVLALLRGDLEVSEAILDGALRIHGEIDDVSRMFQAIEILLDASPRCPMLHLLSRQFVAEATYPDHSRSFPRARWYPFAVSPEESALLKRYGLLP